MERICHQETTLQAEFSDAISSTKTAFQLQDSAFLGRWQGARGGEKTNDGETLVSGPWIWHRYASSFVTDIYQLVMEETEKQAKDGRTHDKMSPASRRDLEIRSHSPGHTYRDA